MWMKFGQDQNKTSDVIQLLVMTVFLGGSPCCVVNINSEKECLHHSRFPDSGCPADFVSPGNVESALLSNTVYREGFYEVKENLRRLNSTSH